jgi:hypothetical protein
VQWRRSPVVELSSYHHDYHHDLTFVVDTHAVSEIIDPNVQTTFITCCAPFWMASRRAPQNWNVTTNGEEANSHRREPEPLGYTVLDMLNCEIVKLELLR